jgi:hypothetical protein
MGTTFNIIFAIIIILGLLFASVYLYSAHTLTNAMKTSVDQTGEALQERPIKPSPDYSPPVDLPGKIGETQSS